MPWRGDLVGGSDGSSGSRRFDLSGGLLVCGDAEEGGIEFGCRRDRLRNIVVAKWITGAETGDLGEEVDLS